MLSRLALRLAAVQALAPAVQLDYGAMPTIAGTAVYDSRMDPIDGADRIEAIPIVSVYTEAMEAVPFGSGVSRPDDLECDLVVEVMILTKAKITLQLPDGSTSTQGALDTPVTDRQHEALLDLLEAQIVKRLEARADYDDDTALFRKVAKTVKHISSVPQRDSTRTVKLAARTISFRIKIPKDVWPDPSLSPTIPAGLDALPEPLRTIAYALPAQSSGALLCADIADCLRNPAALLQLLTVDVKQSTGRTPTATAFDMEWQSNF